MREAYDRDHDAFRDHWTGVILDGKHRADPFHLCFDHFYPVRPSRLAICLDHTNLVKAELWPEEFCLAISELAPHHDGVPFRRDLIAFRFWRRRARHGHQR